MDDEYEIHEDYYLHEDVDGYGSRYVSGSLDDMNLPSPFTV